MWSYIIIIQCIWYCETLFTTRVPINRFGVIVEYWSELNLPLPSCHIKDYNQRRARGERKTLNQQTLIVVGCLRRAFQRSIIYANVPLPFRSAVRSSGPAARPPFVRKGLRLCSNINNHAYVRTHTYNLYFHWVCTRARVRVYIYEIEENVSPPTARVARTRIPWHPFKIRHYNLTGASVLRFSCNVYNTGTGKIPQACFGPKIRRSSSSAFPSVRISFPRLFDRYSFFIPLVVKNRMRLFQPRAFVFVAVHIVNYRG
jgi:hypothetical protein